MDEIKKEIIPDIRSEMTKEFEGHWKHYLISQVSSVEQCLVLNGIDYDQTKKRDFFANFCKNDLKMSDDDMEKLDVKDIRHIKVKSGSKCTSFGSLGSVFQRNICLKHSKNLIVRATQKQKPGGTHDHMRWVVDVTATKD